jgi:hypothetical protein
MQKNPHHDFYMENDMISSPFLLNWDLHITRSDLRKTGWGGEVWIHLAQDMDQWMALVNTVRKFWVAKMLGNSRLTVTDVF